MTRYVDLSHPLEPGMPMYPGLPEPRFGAVADHDSSVERYEGKAEFFLGEMSMPTNTGTYIDAPFHRFRNAADLSDIPLERLVALDCVVVDHDPDGGREVRGRPPERARGGAVLFRSGWDRRWGSDAYWEPGPYLGSETLDDLIAVRPSLVGVDFWNVDDTADPARPAHTRLLQAGILIVEHLCNLAAIPRDGARFSAPVLRVAQGASFPVRAFAEIPDG